MDFAFMFIPSEAIYYDLLVNKVGAVKVNTRDLIEYAFRERKVIIVSPTTFLAYLQTVLQGLRALKIEESVKDVLKHVSNLQNHIISYEDYLKRLGNNLGTTVNMYNNAYKEFAKIDKDVIKITGKETKIDTNLIDKPRMNDES
jgi:DNA recombination protein RmuC